MAGVQKLISLGLALILALSGTWAAFAADGPDSTAEAAGQPAASGVEVRAKSAILLEQSTGMVLYEENADERMPPASITKVMTLLLVMEALEAGKIKLDEMVTCSPHANSMGGSQIWFKEGEQLPVQDLLKATAVASANDAAVALAELVAGSEEAFVGLMNERASQLGMDNTHFVNASGLDADGHLTTARDIAIMSRELMKHEKIKEYTTIWMDSLRGGATQLVNTNKLVRFYDGATGLKTGTTNGAGSCLSATATRGELSLVAVCLGSATSDERFYTARSLLDYGFANYGVAAPPPVDSQLTPVKVLRGVEQSVEVVGETPEKMVVKKGEEKKLTQRVELAPDVQAPVEQGQKLGRVIVEIDGKQVMEYPLTAGRHVDQMTFGKAFSMLVKKLISL